jgi:hypothetical protein
MPCREYVSVSAVFDADGQISPKIIRPESGKTFEIDHILDIRPAASLKAGGCGIRYTCRIQGKLFYLFLDNNRWFVETAV